MEPQEIKHLGINSSTRYFNHLSLNTKEGKTEIQIFSIVPNDGTYILHIGNKIHNTDGILFLINEIEYDTLQIQIEDYDEDTKQLVVKPIKNLETLFESLNPQDIVIVVDLKFLVKRVEEWYTINGDKIKLPHDHSKLNSIDISYLPNEEPSTNQKNAINIVFQHPFCYIWGAPGTGKTKYILAYSILHYIKKGMKVAILAPTNNAIEQVLYGVFDMMNKSNVDIKTALRLGTPSKRFSNDYPEVCEIKGLRKRIERIDKNILKAKNCIQQKKLLNKILVAKSTDKYFPEIEELFIQYQEINEKLSFQSKELILYENEFNNLNSRISFTEQEIENLQIKFKTIIYGIKRTFKKGETKEKRQYFELLDLNQKQNVELTELNNKIKTSQNTCTTLKSDLERLNKRNDALNTIKVAYSSFEESKAIFEYLNLGNFPILKKRLEDLIQEKIKLLIQDNLSLKTINQFKIETLEAEINNLENQKEKINASSIEERLKSAQLIALTLDHYIYRFKEKSLNVDHIFVDEAGYANIAKGLTLFTHDTPITFLGDHYQLPPVCQMNDDIIINPENNDVFIWSQSAIFIENIFSLNKNEAFQFYIQGQPSEICFSIMKSIFLEETYRFGNELAEILDTHVYKKGFRSGNPSRSLKIQYINVPHFYPQPIIQKNGKNKPDRNNRFETQAIKKFLLLENPFTGSILTPYNEQVIDIGNNLQHIRNDERVLSVHRSQGKEWDTVILSIVDTDRKWFSDSLNVQSKGKFLLNTALSRTKDKLIIVCNYDYWISQEGQMVKDLLMVAKEI